MKFLLIVGSKSHKTVVQHMISEAKKNFDTVLSVSIDQIRIECENGETKLFCKQTDLTTFDACYTRFFSNDFVFGEIVLDILENSGVYLPVGTDSFQISNHKYSTVRVLSKAGLRVPTSGLVVSQDPAAKMASKIGYPMVVKLLSGFGGKGIMLVHSEEDFKPLLDTMIVFKEFVAIQEFIESNSEDLRCFVVGEKVYVVKRKAIGGEWRSNVSRGASAKIVSVPDNVKNIALKSAKILGFELGAVDLIQKGKNYYVVEANFSPGILWKFFGKKFARIFMKFIYESTKERKLQL